MTAPTFPLLASVPALLILVNCGHAVAIQRPESPAATCVVTGPNGKGLGYGNGALSTFVWPEGTVVFKPGGPGFLTRDGALGMKFGWQRDVRGKLEVQGRRLDGRARKLRADIPAGYGDADFQATFLIFPTPGCWEVTGQVGSRKDSKLTFVTKVVKIGDGPAWRNDPPGK